jgi:hypothetical protein
LSPRPSVVSPSQCRERWYNHLDPSIKRTAWSPEEDTLIITLQHNHGNKWADFALQIAGRTDVSPSPPARALSPSRRAPPRRRARNRLARQL